MHCLQLRSINLSINLLNLDFFNLSVIDRLSPNLARRKTLNRPAHRRKQWSTTAAGSPAPNSNAGSQKTVAAVASRVRHPGGCPGSLTAAAVEAMEDAVHKKKSIKISGSKTD